MTYLYAAGQPSVIRHIDTHLWKCGRKPKQRQKPLGLDTHFKTQEVCRVSVKCLQKPSGHTTLPIYTMINHTGQTAHVCVIVSDSSREKYNKKMIRVEQDGAKTKFASIKIRKWKSDRNSNFLLSGFSEIHDNLNSDSENMAKLKNYHTIIMPWKLLQIIYSQLSTTYQP